MANRIVRPRLRRTNKSPKATTESSSEGQHRRVQHDKWLERDTIHLGDCRTLLPRIEPESLALSVWSPPYWVGKSYEVHLSFGDWQSLVSTTIRLHYPILKPGAFLAINIADILCFRDEQMPRIQLANISKHRSP